MSNDLRTGPASISKDLLMGSVWLLNAEAFDLCRIVITITISGDGCHCGILGRRPLIKDARSGMRNCILVLIFV